MYLHRKNCQELITMNPPKTTIKTRFYIILLCLNFDSMEQIEFVKRGSKIGAFILKYNFENSPYYNWVEYNYYLFGHGKDGGHFWGNGSFDVNNGNLTSIKNELHVNVGGWKRQIDNSLFVFDIQQEIGFILEGKNDDKEFDVFWAKLNPDYAYKFEFQKMARLNQIANNPTI